MPAEASRLQRRLGRRDLRVLFAICVLAVVGSFAAIAFAAAGGRNSKPACVQLAQAGVLGGGTWHFCGSGGLAACRLQARHNVQLAAACARLRSVLQKEN